MPLHGVDVSNAEATLRFSGGRTFPRMQLRNPMLYFDVASYLAMSILTREGEKASCARSRSGRQLHPDVGSALRWGCPTR